MGLKTETGSIELLAVDAQVIFFLAVKFPLHCCASRSVLTSTSIICTSIDASFITKLSLLLIFNYFVFNYSVKD